MFWLKEYIRKTVNNLSFCPCDCEENNNFFFRVFSGEMLAAESPSGFHIPNTDLDLTCECTVPFPIFKSYVRTINRSQPNVSSISNPRSEQSTVWMESDAKSAMHYLRHHMSHVNWRPIFGELLIISQSCKEPKFV